MCKGLSKIISRDSGPFWQFVKYGAIGVASTLVQLVVFYLLASTFVKCLGPDDWAVKFLGLPAAEFIGAEPWYASRGMLASGATAVGFTVANVFCYIMNRAFVFTPGRFRWQIEFAMFFAAAAFATFIALVVMKILIDFFGVMTSLAVVVEVAISFLVNFIVRKYLIFKR